MKRPGESGGERDEEQGGEYSGEQGREQGDFLKFLGTAGARFVVTKQLRASGGIWFSIGGEEILVDPGPGALVRCLASHPKQDPFRLNGIILTHRHIDHANDVNIMIEAMTNGGRERRGFLYAPRDAFLPPDPVVQSYVRSFLVEIACLEEGKVIQHAGFRLETPVRHRHPVETYGLKFILPDGNISLIADTAFFPELIDHYGGCALLILNVVIFQDVVSDRIYHLNYRQAAELIEAINPKAAILTHFGMSMLQQKPFLLARKLEDKLGVRVIAASDGMKFPLSDLF